MATVRADGSAGAAAPEDGGGRRRPRRRDTSHLKLVPAAREDRDSLLAKCEAAGARLDKSHPLSTEELEAAARATLEEAELPEGYVGWAMVAIATAFWRDQVAAIPPSRRLLLLPHCLKHAEGPAAGAPPQTQIRQRRGACSIEDFHAQAEKLGYKVLVAEGSPNVLKIIVSGHVDAIIGVACLDVLEKAIDKILLAGIPCMAVPLLSNDCDNTSVDADWFTQMIATPHVAPRSHTTTYVHLMRAAAKLFEPAELQRIVPRLRKGPSLADLNGEGIGGLDPLAGTEAIAYDFLARGGKHSRPFITLAVYDALTGGHATQADGPEVLARLPDAVKRTAMSIETFHKASLVHDDIEDDDQFRYGEMTLHRKFGTPTAINVGDYLIGMGYQLVGRDVATLGADVVADILARLADAHMKLAEGQGAELLWRDSRNKRLTPSDALKIYALKTAPAFEAAIYSGLRLAGPVVDPEGIYGQFAHHLGVAFQILNDLNDWRGDDNNKLLAGADVLGGRPTVLWALALERLNDAERAELERMAANDNLDESAFARARQLYVSAGVFEQAERLVSKHHDRAEAIAEQVTPDELSRLFCYLVDTVLERPTVESLQFLLPTLPEHAPAAT